MVKKKQEKKKVKTKKVKTSVSLPEIDLKALLEAGCHFGHRVSKTNPKARPFIYTARGGVQIFDLLKTAQCMEEAGRFLAQTVSQGGKVVLLGTKRQAREAIRKAAKKTKMPFVVNRWLGGAITNWKQISKQIDKLKKLKEDWDKGVFEKRTKKEQSVIKKDIFRMETSFGGLASLKKRPEALFVVDIAKEHTAIKEARAYKIPIVAIVDSNGNPDLVDYPIPANDDAKKSLQLIIDWLTEVIVSNMKEREDEEK